MAKYTVEGDIGAFAGMGAITADQDFWVSDANSTIKKLNAISYLSQLATYKAGRSEFQNRVARAKSLLKDDSKKIIAVKGLDKAMASISGWEKEAKTRTKNFRNDWKIPASHMAAALKAAVDIVLERTTTWTEVVTHQITPEEKAAEFSSQKSTAPTSEAPKALITAEEILSPKGNGRAGKGEGKVESAGIPKVAYLAGAGALILGYLMFMRKK